MKIQIEAHADGDEFVILMTMMWWCDDGEMTYLTYVIYANTILRPGNCLQKSGVLDWGIILIERRTWCFGWHIYFVSLAFGNVYLLHEMEYLVLDDDDDDDDDADDHDDDDADGDDQGD